MHATHPYMGFTWFPSIMAGRDVIVAKPTLAGPCSSVCRTCQDVLSARAHAPHNAFCSCIDCPAPSWQHRLRNCAEGVCSTSFGTRLHSQLPADQFACIARATWLPQSVTFSPLNCSAGSFAVSLVHSVHSQLLKCQQVHVTVASKACPA